MDQFRYTIFLLKILVAYCYRSNYACIDLCEKCFSSIRTRFRFDTYAIHTIHVGGCAKLVGLVDKTKLINNWAKRQQDKAHCSLYAKYIYHHHHHRRRHMYMRSHSITFPFDCITLLRFVVSLKLSKCFALSLSLSFPRLFPHNNALFAAGFVNLYV